MWPSVYDISTPRCIWYSQLSTSTYPPKPPHTQTHLQHSDTPFHIWTGLTDRQAERSPHSTSSSWLQLLRNVTQLQALTLLNWLRPDLSSFQQAIPQSSLSCSLPPPQHTCAHTHYAMHMPIMSSLLPLSTWFPSPSPSIMQFFLLYHSLPTFLHQFARSRIRTRQRFCSRRTKTFSREIRFCFMWVPLFPK